MPYTLELMNRAASAFSVELRFPFWDKRLVEFCLAIPPEQKIHRGWTRMVLRRGLAGILPKKVQWRGGKSNLGPSFTHGFLKFEQQRLRDVVFDHPEILESYADIPALREAAARFASGRAQDGDEFAVWRSVTLALWLKSQSWTGSVR
jgi:asparagine synthase (glutamine-hydrolysing)